MRGSGVGRTPLREEDLGPDPFVAYKQWWEVATASGEPQPEAAALATSTSDGRPSVRFVLVRAVDDRGFVFFTNTRSRKGAEMAATGWASLAFRWALSNRQVRVGGQVAQVAPEESDAYFETRERESQLGAWASLQSEELASRADLEHRFAEVVARYEGVPVPRPPWWGGYRIHPLEMEFWQEGEFRLHDRFRYSRSGTSWVLRRLHP
jgi:pyridoxamine 5'-phosphate oxidase